MPKIVKGTSDEREAFILETFRKDPEMSAAKANKALIAKFGSMMRNKRVYQLRDQAQKEAGKRGSTPAPVQIVVAARGSVAPAALITGTPDQLQFLGSVFEQLKGQGLAALRIDHQTPAYVVVAQG